MCRGEKLVRILLVGGECWPGLGEWGRSRGILVSGGEVGGSW